MAQQSIERAPLSQSIAALRAALSQTEALAGRQVADLVEFHRRLLADLETFAADYERARAMSPSPPAISYAAAAAVRLYQRLSGPAAPLASPLVERSGCLPDNVIALDRFRAGAVGRADQGGAA